MNRVFNFSAGPATLPEAVLQEAQEHLHELLRDVPNLTIANLLAHYGTRSDPEKRRFIDGLRKVGLPE